jgi:hypothetical protein
MSTIKVKKEFQNTVVGFNNSGLPLGKRNDLHLLLNDAIGEDDSIRNEHITGMFEDPLPKKADLKKIIEGDLVKRAEAVKISSKAKKAQTIIAESEEPDPTIMAPERPAPLTEDDLQQEEKKTPVKRARNHKSRSKKK